LKIESGLKNRHLVKRIVLPAMILMLIFTLILATAVGAVNIPFGETVKIILKNFHIPINADFAEGNESIIFYIRFPRVIVAMLVGAGLAVSGVVMQGMFRNPMADPGILGVSSGAGLGAVTAIALGLTARSLFFLPFFASAGSLLASFIIFILSSKKGKVTSLTLILSGLAVSMFISAITSMLLTSIHGDQVKEFLFWTTGGLSARRWEHAAIAAVPIVTCTIILIAFARDLNILMLGEEEAQSVGLNTSATRKLLLFLTSITTAAAICVSGSISFVGLIVPHIMRLIVGPDHRTLIPVSAIAGALFVVACDMVSRIIFAPREIGVGIVTSLIGAPYFLFLLYRARKEGGAI